MFFGMKIVLNRKLTDNFSKAYEIELCFKKISEEIHNCVNGIG
jgi:hypothetical protein